MDYKNDDHSLWMQYLQINQESAAITTAQNKFQGREWTEVSF